jgi:ribosomal protein S18 acetylase RimI-like enzyme
MEDQGIFQWTLDYPSEAHFRQDIERNELFCLWNPRGIVGCIVISNQMDEEYKAVTWLTPNINNYYIHRLAVHPKFQRRGYAQQLMAFAENRARQQKMASIRLDTFSLNKRNQNFYMQRGYKRLGTVYFLSQSKHPFYCYELVL